MEPLSLRKRDPLHVPELLHHVLGHLAEPPYSHYNNALVSVIPPGKEGQCALAALAQTCRMFSEPSLNCLWRKLDSLTPLLRCFTTADDFDETGKVLRNPPSQAEWRTINRYSHRIQELELIRLDDSDPSVFLLKCSVFEHNLFPNLTVLSWYSSCNLIRLIQPLLSPKLSSFILSDVCELFDDMEMTSFLKTLPSRCPALKVLSINIRDLDDGELITDALSCAIPNFKEVHRLAVHNPLIDDAALRHLAMSPQFTQLIITSHQSQVEGLALPLSDTPFSGIKELDLSSLDLGSIAGLLRPEGQAFSIAEFHLDSSPIPNTMHSFLTALASQPRQSSLTSVTLDIASHSHPVPVDNIRFDLSHDTLQPLTLLRNLRELRIDLGNRISLNNKKLASLARGWPLLQVLELGPMDGLSTKRVTLRGLLSLSVACPKLREVALSLDCRKVPMQGVGTDVCSVTLETMTFRGSPINDPYLVAAFLLTYFPSVTSVLHSCYVEPYAERWKQVQQFLDRKNQVSLVLRVS